MSAWELPTGGRPQAKTWICLAVTQPWEITFPTAHSTTGGMHLPHAAPHHNPPKSGLPIFHLLSKHPESPEVPSIPGEERMDMGQGKGAGPEVQGETLEKDCGQRCYGVWEKCLWQWPWPFPPQPQESTGLPTLCTDRKRSWTQPFITLNFLRPQALGCPGWAPHVSMSPFWPRGEVGQRRRAQAAASHFWGWLWGSSAVVSLQAILQWLSEGLRSSVHHSWLLIRKML